MFVPGQALVLQSRPSFSIVLLVPFPSVNKQSKPPRKGGGLSHTRSLFWFPPPQGTLQLVKGVQDPQLPFAKKNIQSMLNSPPTTSF